MKSLPAHIAKTYFKGAKITIRRPNGQIEVVSDGGHAINGVIPAVKFAKMIAANKAAGRGEILNQEPVVVEYTREDQRESIVGVILAGKNAFPGTKAWFAMEAAHAELAKFDAEVVA